MKLFSVSSVFCAALVTMLVACSGSAEPTDGTVDVGEGQVTPQGVGGDCPPGPGGTGCSHDAGRG